MTTTMVTIYLVSLVIILVIASLFEDEALLPFIIIALTPVINTIFAAGAIGVIFSDDRGKPRPSNKRMVQLASWLAKI